MTTALSGSELLGSLRRARLLRDDESVTDGHLLEAYIATRDEAAFEALVHRHSRMVLGVCRRVLGDPTDVEDAFQATFLVLVRKARSIVPRELVGNWLYGVAHRTATSAKIMKARQSAKERAGVKPASQGDDPGPDLWPILDQELSLLPDKYRAPIVLCDLEGKTQKEAARLLGCPEGTVSTRLRTARGMLAKALTRHGVSISGAVLATLLPRVGASASVPVAMASSTTKAATLLAAGKTAGGISERVLVLTEGVLKTMLVSKLRVALAVLLVAALVGSVGALVLDNPAGAAPPRAEEANKREIGESATGPGGWVAFRAAPVPKAKPDPGLIWVVNRTTRALTAYAPDGQKVKEVTLPDGNQFIDFTPDGRKMAFVWTGKIEQKGAESTLRLCAVNDTTADTDTGVPARSGDWLIWSARGDRVVRVRSDLAQKGYAHALYDLGTKKETQLDLSEGHQAFGIAPDGEWLLTVECLPGRATGGAYKVPLAGGKPTQLGDRKLSLMSARISPDGGTLVCFGKPEKPGPGEDDGDAVYVLDVKSGAVTRIARHKEQTWSKGYWSPDGNRIAYLWSAGADQNQSLHLEVCDKDGRNAKTLWALKGDSKDDVWSTDIVGWLPK
jgi:RNA polymerase sigma factor (sigma-70 family)